MLNFLSRHQMYELIDNNEIKCDEDGSVICYPKPQGMFCHLSKCENTGSVIIHTADVEYIDSALGNQLWDVGVRGMFILKTDTNSRGITKWLSYNMISVELSEWIYKISIYIPDTDAEIKPSDLHITKLCKLKVPFEDLYYRINRMSRDETYDGMIVNLKKTSDESDVKAFLVPTRYISGNVESIIRDDLGTIKALVTNVHYQNRNYIVLVNVFTKNITEQLEAGEVTCGQRITLQYTSFIGGKRLRNFASPILVTLK